MNKKNEILKDLIIELDKTYKQYGDEPKVKQILEANGYKVQVITNYNWFIDLDNNRFLQIDFCNQVDKRYFHLAIKEKNNPLLDRLKILNNQKEQELKSHYDKTYMTNKNNINKLLTFQIGDTKEYLKNKTTDNPKDKLWQKIIDKERLNMDQMEHHLIINPKVENYSADKLFDIFTKGLGRFYSQNHILGNKFHKHKDQQMMVYITLEYGSNDIRPDEKGTHFHILLKSNHPEWFDELHPFMEKFLKQKIGGDVNYQYHLVDTPEYRINVYNYLPKENRKIWTNNDIYNNHKKDIIYKPKLDAYDRILQKTCHTTDYDAVFRQRAQEEKMKWEQYLKDKQNQANNVPMSSVQEGNSFFNFDK